MNQYLRFAMRFSLLVTPLFASSVLVNSSSLAATFASSQGDFNFTDFSQSPSGIASDTNTNTSVFIAKEGNGTAQAEAKAVSDFLATPLTASNSSLSTAFGENRNYLGSADSQATVIGNFDVNANTPFSFNFTSVLNLQASIDNIRSENARASGDISFLLVDTDQNSVLDFFSLTGNLVTPGEQDFLATQKSDDVALTTISKDVNFAGNQKFAQTNLQGSLNHFFTDQTSLTLVEVKRTRAEVTAVPESSTNLALLVSFGVVGVAFKGRCKENTCEGC